MHKISKENIQDLAEQIAAMVSNETSYQLLEKARELYEEIILLHHYSNSVKEKKISVDIADHQEDVDDLVEENIELSVQERIRQIMEDAAKLEVNSKSEKPLTEYKKDQIESPLPDKSKEKNKLHPSLEDEFKDAISADYAANLFENAEKIELSKKSLNDILSQKQIQIGLNDRIAFVKHLFNNNQVDFNRVLSQLNSFQTETQAKHFIETVVKPEYNWGDENEYAKRLTELIERKFL